MYRILYTHEDFVVISKPYGESFHDFNAQKGFFHKAQEQIGGRLFPVHRLDRVTSGAIIIAKNKKAAQTLSEMFRERKVDKWYVALAKEKPKKKRGTVSGGLMRSRQGQWKLSRGRENYAITRFISEKLETQLYFFLLKPETGRTHQLRVTMNSLGSPIFGDPLYNSTTSFLSDRTYLHSLCLSFVYKNRKISIFDTLIEGKLFNQINVQEKIEKSKLEEMMYLLCKKQC